MDSQTIFSRQVTIEDWKQDKLSQQIVLILGVGGIGSVATTNLLRLGVKKIFLVDYDHVELHNLNRQILYSNKDVNQQKVKAAFENATFHNVGNAEIQMFDLDAVKNWDKIVELASQSTAIFNCIDYGDYWDAAVQSLCLYYKIPMIIAGSFAQSFMAELYLGTPCYACMTDGLKEEYLNQITQENITQLKDISFLPANNKPQGQSHQVLCSTAGNFATQLLLNYLNEQADSQTSKKVLFYLTTFEVVIFPVFSKNNCHICKYQEPAKEQQIQATEPAKEQQIQATEPEKEKLVQVPEPEKEQLIQATETEKEQQEQATESIQKQN
ncbi:unnamed protein product (macronuclear) [Paramecium tetraurelia]|uniref:THIF-type NAD/FAD binding fold domain-containing protein n=1 Tax=Paramecium tetraurelia TaxID=5888 RepID=A0DFL6_PARTE|nr:uncharacterized protein GSPATT00016646001 [Paramecium tetraurelia]CAK81833.1 unnamed protein product [Paramecium tetraurelia]|eukprot:XP_001449230.1 hypothetical protein (macronuclear) [Paramecium tetraurelia strain d4-2]